MLDFSNYSTKSKYYDDSSKFVDGKMKDEAAGIRIKEFAGLKPNMNSFLADDSSEHKKVQGVNENVNTTIIHNEYKNIFLNNKYFKHSMYRIQNENQRIRPYEINKISLSCFSYKIYIQSNG